MTDTYVYYLLRVGCTGEKVVSKRRATLNTIEAEGEAILKSQLVVDHSDVDGGEPQSCWRDSLRAVFASMLMRGSTLATIDPKSNRI